MDSIVKGPRIGKDGDEDSHCESYYFINVYQLGIPQY